MNLDDERLHRKRVPWAKLAKEGVDPQKILVEAQKRRMWKLARSAKYRIEHVRRTSEV